MNNSPQTRANSASDDDLEQLSAYLDNQLSAAERVNLERRLGVDPGLQAELEDLRAVSAALRSLDSVTPPRSFALDPAQVARPRRFFPVTWFMQLGSGLAGLALVLLASMQLLAAGFGGSAPVPAAAPMAAATLAPMAAEAGPLANSEMRLQATEVAAAPTAAPAAESVPVPAATSAPATASEAPAAQAAAATPAPTMAAASAPAAADQAPAAGAPAGGEAGGPASNSSVPAAPPSGGAGGAPSIDATIGATQDAGYAAGAAPAPREQPEAPQVQAAEPSGIVGPGFTLALGFALLAFAIGWNLASRRRV